MSSDSFFAGCPNDLKNFLSFTTGAGAWLSFIATSGSGVAFALDLVVVFEPLPSADSLSNATFLVVRFFAAFKSSTLELTSSDSTSSGSFLDVDPFDFENLRSDAAEAGAFLPLVVTSCAGAARPVVFTVFFELPPSSDSPSEIIFLVARFFRTFKSSVLESASSFFLLSSLALVDGLAADFVTGGGVPGTISLSLSLSLEKLMVLVGLPSRRLENSSSLSSSSSIY